MSDRADEDVPGSAESARSSVFNPLPQTHSSSKKTQLLKPTKTTSAQSLATPLARTPRCALLRGSRAALDMFNPDSFVYANDVMGAGDDYAGADPLVGPPGGGGESDRMTRSAGKAA